ncbi:MAG: hypothetical protein AAGA92_06885 [Planctomycetota bacterium]
MALPTYALADHAGADPEDLGQLNVEPAREGSLWKVIIPAIRCPVCGSTQTKAETGKRTTSQGLSEHYRSCPKCSSRFRVVFE